jgi:hypothetical protein
MRICIESTHAVPQRSQVLSLEVEPLHDPAGDVYAVHESIALRRLLNRRGPDDEYWLVDDMDRRHDLDPAHTSVCGAHVFCGPPSMCLEQVRDLLRCAVEAGDLATAAAARKALDGDPTARAQVAYMVA